MCYYELPTFQKLIGSSSICSSVNTELINQATTRRQLRKRYLKSEVALLQTLSRLLYLSQFVKCWQFFLELNSKRLYWSSGKERESCCLVSTYSTKCEIRYFHVVVAQWRQRNIRDARAELLICRSKPLTLFCRSHWRRRRSGELKQRPRQRQRERQKRKRFRLAKQQLCTCIMLCCTFVCRHCTTTTWNCLISRSVDSVNTRQRRYFSFPELWYSLLKFNSRKNCQHLTNWTRWNKRD